MICVDSSNISERPILEWMKEKNNSSLFSHNVGDPTKYWWKCLSCGEEWQTRIRNRRLGSGCPRCARVGRRNKRLDRLYPELMREWDSQKNKEPMSYYGKGSTVSPWWICPKCGHSYCTSLAHKIQKGDCCPRCKNSKTVPIPNKTDLATLFPKECEEWDYQKNSSSPSEYTPYSTVKAHWICSRGHKWSSLIADRFRDFETRAPVGCPYCCYRKPLAGFNDIKTTDPEVASEWLYSKRGKKITEITKHSSEICGWKCRKCGHEWETSSRRRIIEKIGCSNCAWSIKAKVATCEKSFAAKYPEFLQYWDYEKNAISPESIYPNNTDDIFWKCQLGHSFTRSPKSILKYHKQALCPYCGNREVLPGYNDIATTHPEWLQEWDYDRNENCPEQYHQNNGEKVWWRCKNGHSYKTSCCTRHQNNSGCPECHHNTSKGEEEVASFIGEKYSGRILRGDRTAISPLELDIYLPEIDVAIEYNGVFWHSDANKADKDVHFNKYKACLDNGISLIQIWEDDWCLKQKIVKNMLLHKIGASSEKRIFARNTTVKEIPASIAKLFLEKYHIQGFCRGSAYLGAFNKAEQLVAVSVWTRDKDSFRLDRYATSQSVVGGFGKMLKYIQKNCNIFNVSSVYTFSNNEVSDGGLYRNLGFEVERIIPPDYSYLCGNRRVHKFNFRKKRFQVDKSLKYEEGLSESQLAALNSIYRVWDSGKIKWRYVL